MDVVDVGPRYDGDYHVVVRRPADPDRLDVYPIRLARRLPVVRVPLREADADVALDLQAIVDLVYANGWYDRTDYDKPCSPPPAGDEAAWADGLLRAAGRRG